MTIYTPDFHPVLSAQIEELARRHHPTNLKAEIDAAQRLRLFLRTLDIYDGDLADHLNEGNFRLFERKGSQSRRTKNSFVSRLRSYTATLHGEKRPLRPGTTKPRPVLLAVHDLVQVADKLIADKDPAAAAAFVAVLGGVQFRHFGDVLSLRHVIRSRSWMPSDFRRIAERLLDEVPNCEEGRITRTAWYRVIDASESEHFGVVQLRRLEKVLNAEQSQASVAELLGSQAIDSITHRDELSETTTDPDFWCTLSNSGPIADSLVEHVHELEGGADMPTRPPSKAEARRRARELSEKHANPEPLPKSHYEWLTTRRPRDKEVRKQWSQIKGPVAQVGLRCGPVDSINTYKRMMINVTKIFAAASAAGQSLDPADVLNERSIAVYIGGLHVSDSARADYRSALRAAAKHWPGTGIVQRPQQIRFAHPHPPYSSKELNTLERVMSGQRQDTVGKRAKLFFALGIGGGIGSQELALLEREHIHPSESGNYLVVDVPAHGEVEARTVPIINEWRELLEAGLPESEGPLIPPHAAHNHINSTYKKLKTESDHPPVQQTRLRNTWTVHLLGTPGISAKTILTVSGLKSTRNWNSLLAYAPDQSDVASAVAKSIYRKTA